MVKPLPAPDIDELSWISKTLMVVRSDGLTQNVFCLSYVHHHDLYTCVRTRTH